MLNNDSNQKRRKRSYYQFSKNYPSRRGNSYDIGESRTRKKKEQRNRRWFYVMMVILFVAVFVISYVFIYLSRKPIDNNNLNNAVSFDGQFKAIYMPDDALSGGIAFDLFKSKLEDIGVNAVVIDFKKPSGKLNYTSQVGTAVDLSASDTAYANAENTIKQLKEYGYKIIARVYCYEDVLAASTLVNASVTEKDGVSVWLDNSAQRDGNPWLNPYSTVAENYIISIIAESVSIGADAVILASVNFPQSDRLDQAFFAGEAESIESRNSKLHSFVEKASAVCGDVPVMFYMNVDQALNGSEALFGGGMFDSGALFDVVDFRADVLKDGFPLVNSVYSQQTFTPEQLINTAVPTLMERLNDTYTTKAIIPIINNRENVSILQKMGINNYILIESENT